MVRLSQQISKRKLSSPSQSNKVEEEAEVNMGNASPEVKAEVFQELVKEAKKLSMSLDLSRKRNTAIDKLLDRQCYTCNSLQPPYVHHCYSCN